MISNFVNMVAITIGHMIIFGILTILLNEFFNILYKLFTRSFKLWMLLLDADKFHEGKVINSKYKDGILFHKLLLYVRIILSEGLDLIKIKKGEAWYNNYWYFSLEKQYVKGKKIDD